VDAAARSVDVARGAGDGADGPLRVLFLMPRLGFLRFFQAPLDLLLERGHDVRLLVESPRTEPVEEHWLARARVRPNFRYEVGDQFKGAPLRDARISLRVGMEYVRRLGPEYENRIAGRPRTRLSRAPELVKRLAALPGARTARGVRLLHRALTLVDDALPRPAAIGRTLDAAPPDVLVICDKGHPGSLSSDWVAAAAARGIPTALCVASWDNLTNRQRTPVVPYRLLVWNERQRREAADFHGIPPERVVVTGAPRFDDWFAWQPSDRAAFLAKVGLDPQRPVVLWIGGALNHAEITEAEFVTRWLRALRSSSDERLRGAGVLVRPHPERLPEWSEADYGEFENVAVWPREGMTFPIEDEAKADYYDSIFHAHAVVGINSSAMIEASIVGRPVLTVLAPEFHDSQLATFHFEYLVRDGGPVQVADSMDEHLADLRAVLAAPAPPVSERGRAFVADFVRPLGLERRATDAFVDAVEQIAAARPEPEADPAWVAAPRALLRLWTLRADVRRAAKRARRAPRTIVRRLRKLARRLPRLRKRLRRRWFEHGQPVLSRVLKQPDHLRLARTNAGAALRAFAGRQPPGAFKPDYSDLRFLYEAVRSRRPTTVLEFGSGCSTAVIAAALRENGHGRLWSVESDEDWARVTEAALPDDLRPLVTVVYAPAVEEDRDVPGWSYAHVPDVSPDFVYLDGPPHTRERKVAFDVLDLEPRFAPGFYLVVDGRGRNAYYLRDRFRGRYAFEEHRLRLRHMYRFTFEQLAAAEPALPTSTDAS
jgi:hypothetical protein